MFIGYEYGCSYVSVLPVVAMAFSKQMLRVFPSFYETFSTLDSSLIGQHWKFYLRKHETRPNRDGKGRGMRWVQPCPLTLWSTAVTVQFGSVTDRFALKDTVTSSHVSIIFRHFLVNVAHHDNTIDSQSFTKYQCSMIFFTL